MKTNPKRWKPKEGVLGERYWYITDDFEVWHSYWNGGVFQEKLYEIGNCFKTRKEAQEKAKQIKTLLKS